MERVLPLGGGGGVPLAAWWGIGGVGGWSGLRGIRFSNRGSIFGASFENIIAQEEDGSAAAAAAAAGAGASPPPVASFGCPASLALKEGKKLE